MNLLPDPTYTTRFEEVLWGGALIALTLVIHADKTVTEDQLIHLALLARDAGIQNALLATLPRLINAPAKP